jgi:hypothetical protein
LNRLCAFVPGATFAGRGSRKWRARRLLTSRYMRRRADDLGVASGSQKL